MAIGVHVAQLDHVNAVPEVSDVIILERHREGGSRRIHGAINGAIKLLDDLALTTASELTASEVPSGADSAAMGAVGEAPTIIEECPGRKSERGGAHVGLDGKEIVAVALDGTFGAGILVLEGSPRLVDHRGGEAGAGGAVGIEELEDAVVGGARLGALAGGVGGVGGSGLGQLADVVAVVGVATDRLGESRSVVGLALAGGIDLGAGGGGKARGGRE